MPLPQLWVSSIVDALETTCYPLPFRIRHFWRNFWNSIFVFPGADVDDEEDDEEDALPDDYDEEADGAEEEDEEDDDDA